MSERRQKALDKKRAETETKILTPSPFDHIFAIDFPLPGEPPYVFRRYWIYFADLVNENVRTYCETKREFLAKTKFGVS